MIDRGLLTIAVGGKCVAQARSLSLSCMLHAPHVIRAVITDSARALGAYYDVIIPYDAGAGNPFALKTRLHTLTPFGKTLFLDADSLLTGPVDFCWDALGSAPFIYAGKQARSGLWYFDVADILEKIHAAWLPVFNSGMMLFDDTEGARAVFETALEYMARAEELGVPFFRKDMLPDEPFLAIALALRGVAPFEDYGRFSRTLIGAERIQINVVKGISRFVKQGQRVFPGIVHFCGGLGGVLYLRERIRLALYFFAPLDGLFARLLLALRRLLKGI